MAESCWCGSESGEYSPPGMDEMPYTREPCLSTSGRSSGEYLSRDSFACSWYSKLSSRTSSVSSSARVSVAGSKVRVAQIRVDDGSFQVQYQVVGALSESFGELLAMVEEHEETGIRLVRYGFGR